MVVFKYGVWEGWAFSTVFIINKKIIVPCICLVLFCCFTISYMWILTPLILHKGLGAGGEGDDRGWDGWTASLTWWTWVWVNSGSWWWTGRPGVLQFMGSQRVGHNWVNELNWTELNWYFTILRIGIILFLFYDGRNWGSETCSRWHARKALEQSWVSRVCSLSGRPVSTVHSLS